MLGGVVGGSEAATCDHIPRSSRKPPGKVSHIALYNLHPVVYPQSSDHPNQEVGPLGPTIHQGHLKVRPGHGDNQTRVSSSRAQVDD